MKGCWSDERIETAKRLWAKGFTATQISKRLGQVTRNGVIGKLYGMGIKKGDRKENLRNATLPFMGRNKTHRKSKPPLFAHWKPGRSMISRLKTEPLPDAAIEVVPQTKWSELKDTQCRWIVGDPRGKVISDAPIFCGSRKVPGQPYCKFHCRRAFQTPTPRRRDTSCPANSQVRETEKV